MSWPPIIKRKVSSDCWVTNKCVYFGAKRLCNKAQRNVCVWSRICEAVSYISRTSLSQLPQYLTAGNRIVREAAEKRVVELQKG